jgi:hypothetical protein
MKISDSKGAVLMGSIVDRAVDSATLALMAGIGALLLPMALDENSRNVFWGFAVLVLAFCVVAAAFFAIVPARRVPFRFRRHLVKARMAIRSLVNRPFRVLFALGLALILQTGHVVMILWLGRLAMIQQATFLMWLFVWPLAKLAAMVPLTQGGIGVREAILGVLFVPLGVSIEKAVATGLIFQAIVISGNLLSGLLAVLIGRIASPGAGPAAGGSLARRSVHQPGRTGALALGGVAFFVVNVLTVAHVSGAADATWTAWMKAVPGLDTSFAGSLAGFLYGAAVGYLSGSVLGKLRIL